jgi:hypothetical protein
MAVLPIFRDYGLDPIWMSTGAGLTRLISSMHLSDGKRIKADGKVLAKMT